MIISLWEKNLCSWSKWIIRSGPNSNSFELLCLSSLPASLTKIQSKVTEKSWRDHFFHRSRACNSKMTGQIQRNSNWSEILCLSSCPVNLMKIEFIVTEKRWRYHFPQSQWECSRANNSLVKSPTRPKFKLIWDFMPVLATCKFDKDPIKGDWENMETLFFPLYVNGSFLLPW